MVDNRPDFVCLNIKKFFSWKFFLCACSLTLIILLDQLSDFLHLYRSGESTVWYFYYFSICYSGIYSSYLLPILAALPFSTSVFEERESKVLPMLISHTGIGKYSISKYILNAFCGAITLGLGMLIFTGIFSLRFPLYDSVHLDYAMELEYGWALSGSSTAYFMIGAFLLFLRGAIYATIALISSTYFSNRYIILASPALINFIFFRLYSLLPLKEEFRLDWLYRGKVTLVSDGFTLGFLTILTLTVLVIGGIYFYLRIRKKVKNDIFI